MRQMPKRDFLRLPVVSASAEFLVMGHLMRRNVLAYKAPPNNEGYDLICIHPDPRHRPQGDEAAQVRVQVKSRYATDCDRGFPVKEASLDAFDFLVVAFLNIGKFFGGLLMSKPLKDFLRNERRGEDFLLGFNEISQRLCRRRLNRIKIVDPYRSIDKDFHRDRSFL